MNNSLAYVSAFAIRLYASSCHPDSKIIRLRGAQSEQRPLLPPKRAMPEIVSSETRLRAPVEDKPFYEGVQRKHRNNRANYKIVCR
jgi:hypothetical protein